MLPRVAVDNPISAVLGACDLAADERVADGYQVQSKAGPAHSWPGVSPRPLAMGAAPYAVYISGKE